MFLECCQTSKSVLNLSKVRRLDRVIKRPRSLTVADYKVFVTRVGVFIHTFICRDFIAAVCFYRKL